MNDLEMLAFVVEFYLDNRRYLALNRTSLAHDKGRDDLHVFPNVGVHLTVKPRKFSLIQRHSYLMSV